MNDRRNYQTFPCQLTDRYELLGHLGNGAMGIVYRGRHLILEKHVAIKCLSIPLAADGVVMQRFLREARTAANIEHRNICDVTDFGIDDQGTPFIVMELLSGQTLQEYIMENAPLSPSQAVSLIAQAVSALGAAHSMGIVHRDLKPDNIFLIKRANQPNFVKILDFGLARIETDEGVGKMTQAGAIMGTPFYMSPEQAKGGGMIDQRADLYAVGILLYEMLSGTVPFRGGGNVLSVLLQHIQAPVPSLAECTSGVSAGLQKIVHRLLEKEPDQRFPDARALLEALANLRLSLSDHANTSLAGLSSVPRPADAAVFKARGKTIRKSLMALQAAPKRPEEASKKSPFSPEEDASEVLLDTLHLAPGDDRVKEEDDAVWEGGEDDFEFELGGPGAIPLTEEEEIEIAREAMGEEFSATILEDKPATLKSPFELNEVSFEPGDPVEMELDLPSSAPSFDVVPFTDPAPERPAAVEREAKQTPDVSFRRASNLPTSSEPEGGRKKLIIFAAAGVALILIIAVVFWSTAGEKSSSPSAKKTSAPSSEQVSETVEFSGASALDEDIKGLLGATTLDDALSAIERSSALSDADVTTDVAAVEPLSALEQRVKATSESPARRMVSAMIQARREHLNPSIDVLAQLLSEDPRYLRSVYLKETLLLVLSAPMDKLGEGIIRSFTPLLKDQEFRRALLETAMLHPASTARARAGQLLRADDLLSSFEQWERISVQLRSSPIVDCALPAQLTEMLIGLGEPKSRPVLEGFLADLESKDCSVEGHRYCCPKLYQPLREGIKNLPATQ